MCNFFSCSFYVCKILSAMSSFYNLNRVSTGILNSNVCFLILAHFLCWLFFYCNGLWLDYNQYGLWFYTGIYSNLGCFSNCWWFKRWSATNFSLVGFRCCLWYVICSSVTGFVFGIVGLLSIWKVSRWVLIGICNWVQIRFGVDSLQSLAVVLCFGSYQILMLWFLKATFALWLLQFRYGVKSNLWANGGWYKFWENKMQPLLVSSLGFGGSAFNLLHLSDVNSKIGQFILAYRI